MSKHAPTMRDVALDVAAQPLGESVAVEVPAAGFARAAAFGTGLEGDDVVGKQNLRLFHTAIVAAGCDRPGQSGLERLNRKPAGAAGLQVMRLERRTLPPRRVRKCEAAVRA